MTLLDTLLEAEFETHSDTRNDIEIMALATTLAKVLAYTEGDTQPSNG